jgi:glyoxylase-like metal-dependent hydrolase (beta-lactamase superfamily II)
MTQRDTFTPPTVPSSTRSRRSFLTSSAAVVGASSIAAVLPNALVSPASAESVGAEDLPDYAPIPPSALGPALNDQGYFVGRVKRNLYWVTDGTYQAAFLTTGDGVVLFDAPPTIGNNLQRAVNEVAAANGVSNKVTHLVHSHHHADHAGASSLFGKNVVRIGHEETRRLLLRDNDPTRPAPTVTFRDRKTLNIGGERVTLAYHGTNHTPDNIYIHFPDHDTLMLVDIVTSGWVPIYNANLSEDIPAYIQAPATALSYPWKHLIGGHVGRLGTRRDVALHQQYVADISASARTALATVDPTPVLRQVRPELLGRRQDVPGCGHRLRRRARHLEVHGRPGGCGRLHHQHHARDPGVDRPRPRRRLAGAPVTAIGVIRGAL